MYLIMHYFKCIILLILVFRSTIFVNSIDLADNEIENPQIPLKDVINFVSNLRIKRDSLYKTDKRRTVDNDIERSRLIGPDNSLSKDDTANPNIKINFASFDHANDKEFVDVYNLTASILSNKAQSMTALNALKKNRTLLNFCCDSSKHVYNQSAMECEETASVIPPTFQDEDGNEVHGVVHQPVFGFPNCSFYALSPSTAGPSDSFYISPTGELVVGGQVNPYDFPAYNVKPGRYCLIYPEPDLLEALICFDDNITDDHSDSAVHRTNLQRKVYPVCLLISSVFLFLTLLVHCFIKELREDLLKKCFMCSIAMLAMAQTLMVVRQWNILEIMHTPLCVAIATLTQFSFLSAFLWLNVICCTFLRTLWCPPAPSTSRRMSVFGWQCVYAFGVAAAMSALALCRDELPALQGSVLPQPRFMAVGCWFSSAPALVFYLLGPISILLILNLLSFCLVAYKMATFQKRSDRTVLHFSQYLKLFVLMGVSWIFEVISFFVTTAYGDHPINYIWIFFDMVNILQGVLIFLLFICRRNVLQHIIGKLFGRSVVRRLFSANEDSKEKEDTEVAACNTEV